MHYCEMSPDSGLVFSAACRVPYQVPSMGGKKMAKAAFTYAKEYSAC